MTIVEHVTRDCDLTATQRKFEHDTVTLGWEDRTHGHGKRRTDRGLEFGMALPRGTVLRAGDCFVVPDRRLVIAVVERPEPVFLVEPRTPAEWALFAYHIGNRHQPLMVIDEGLVCPDAPGVEAMLHQHSMPYSRATMPFTPAASAAGHSH